jgi:hypothetical protein
LASIEQNPMLLFLVELLTLSAMAQHAPKTSLLQHDLLHDMQLSASPPCLSPATQDIDPYLQGPEGKS